MVAPQLNLPLMVKQGDAGRLRVHLFRRDAAGALQPAYTSTDGLTGNAVAHKRRAGERMILGRPVLVAKADAAGCLVLVPYSAEDTARAGRFALTVRMQQGEHAERFGAVSLDVVDK